MEPQNNQSAQSPDAFTRERIRLLSMQLEKMYQDMKAERRKIANWEEEQEFSILGVIELFSTDIQGYAEQAILNSPDVLLNSKSVNHLRQLNIFNVDYFAEWYLHNLETYPQIQKYVEQLDHLRLLLIDYLGEQQLNWDIFTLQNIAANPNTPLEVLSKLADNFTHQTLEYRGYIIRKNLAANPNTSVEILEKLLEYSIKQQRMGYFNIENENFIIDDFISLDDIPEIIAKHPKTTSNLLEKLHSFLYNMKIDFIWDSVSSEEIKVNLGVAIAKHVNTPEFILERLAYSKTAYIRECVARNPNTPVSILTRLAEDADDYVSIAASENPTFRRHKL